MYRRVVLIIRIAKLYAAFFASTKKTVLQTIPTSEKSENAALDTEACLDAYTVLCCMSPCSLCLNENVIQYVYIKTFINNCNVFAHRNLLVLQRW